MSAVFLVVNGPSPAQPESARDFWQIRWSFLLRETGRTGTMEEGSAAAGVPGTSVIQIHHQV